MAKIKKEQDGGICSHFVLFMSNYLESCDILPKYCIQERGITLDLLVYNLELNTHNLQIGDDIENSSTAEKFNVKERAFAVDQSFQSYDGLLFLHARDERTKFICILHTPYKRKYLVGELSDMLVYLTEHQLYPTEKKMARFIRLLTTHFNINMKN